MSKELKQEDYHRFQQSDFDYEKKKSTEPIYFVYEGYVQALKEHKIPLSPDMEDKELTIFLTTVDPATVEKKISTVVRRKHINKSGDNQGRKTEYMLWYENWYGKDKNGHIIHPISHLPKGVDKGIETSKMTDAEGVEHYKVERDYWFYTVPFSAEKLDEILAENNVDIESVQYLVKGIRTWGGFSYDEFRNLTFAELEERARTGKVNQPVEIQNQTGNKAKATKVKE